MQFDFLAVLVVFKFFAVLLFVLRGGKVYLPMPPSWLAILLVILECSLLPEDFLVGWKR